MTVATERQRALEVLSRADIRRDAVGHAKSDEDLVRLLVPNVDLVTLRTLTGVSRLLRLMDGLLTGKQTGEGFVEKFSDQWLSLSSEPADGKLKTIFDELEGFYEEIQMFCAFEEHRAEEPSLFGLARLQELTITAYGSIRQKWIDAISKS